MSKTGVVLIATRSHILLGRRCRQAAFDDAERDVRYELWDRRRSILPDRWNRGSFAATTCRGERDASRTR